MKTKIISTKFNTYQEMSQSAKNWVHHCSYKLFPYAFEGEHHIIELPNSQLSYANRKGGFMHDAKSPPHSVSIGIVQQCRGVACFDRFKLQEGMIVFFDDSQAFNFMSNDEIQIAIISIPNAFAEKYKLNFKKTNGKYTFDTNAQFSMLLHNILKAFLDTDNSLDLQDTEDTVIGYVKNLIKTASLQEVKLTKGEKIALAIRDQVYHHIDGKINIESFAKQYKVSVQTLENAFKSLFGFTPKKFLQLLKLNLVHHDLKNADPKTCTVLRIATKWGFFHMGRFSKEYTQLFGENPSETLKSLSFVKDNMISTCTSRQEELI